MASYAHDVVQVNLFGVFGQHAQVEAQEAVAAGQQNSAFLGAVPVEYGAQRLHRDVISIRPLVLVFVVTPTMNNDQ